MEVWFKVSELRSRVGIITDYYGDYIELKEVDTGEYRIVHKNKVELIKDKKIHEAKMICPKEFLESIFE